MFILSLSLFLLIRVLIFIIYSFLVATKPLYMSVCPSVGWFVGRSVGRSVTLLVFGPLGGTYDLSSGLVCTSLTEVPEITPVTYLSQQRYDTINCQRYGHNINNKLLGVA